MSAIVPVKRKAISAKSFFGNVDYFPHDVQKVVHRQSMQHRFRVVCAGRRTGKSTLGGHELALCAMYAYHNQEGLSPKGKRMEYWIVGPEYSDAEKEFRVLYNDLTTLGMEFDHPGTYYDAVGGNMHLSLFGGRFQVHAKSAKYPLTLVGEALHGVILAEAAKLKPTIWTKFIRPMLADYARETPPSWALMTSTPEGKNWFYDQYMRGQDPAAAQWGSVRMPSWSNNILFPDGRRDPEILEMEADMTPEKFKQEIGAEFTEFVGRVFKTFSEEDHVTDLSYDPALPLYVATDYGFTNPNVMLFIQMDHWENVRVIREYYRRGRTSSEFASDIAEDPILGALARSATLIYPDPEDPGATATLADKLKLIPQSGTGGLLRERIDLIRRWLKPGPLELPDGHPEKLPKIMFDRSCKETIREMNDYRYPDSRDELSNEVENPLKKDDHAPEALGRFMGGRFAMAKLENNRARQSRARMRRG